MFFEHLYLVLKSLTAKPICNLTCLTFVRAYVRTYTCTYSSAWHSSHSRFDFLLCLRRMWFHTPRLVPSDTWSSCTFIHFGPECRVSNPGMKHFTMLSTLCFFSSLATMQFVHITSVFLFLFSYLHFGFFIVIAIVIPLYCHTIFKLVFFTFIVIMITLFGSWPYTLYLVWRSLLRWVAPTLVPKSNIPDKQF